MKLSVDFKIATLSKNQMQYLITYMLVAFPHDMTEAVNAMNENEYMQSIGETNDGLLV